MKPLLFTNSYNLKVMELLASIKETWLIFIIGSLISCLMLLFLLNENHQNASLSINTSLTLPKENKDFPSLEGLSETSDRPSMIVVKAAIDTPNNNVSTMIAQQHHELPIAANTNNKVIVAIHPLEILDSLNKTNLTSQVSHNNIIDKSNDVVNSVKEKCNIFDGRWVYKEEVEPSYCPLKCPFIEEKMSCKKNGRPNLEYEKWVWEARDCDIPMLDGRDMVERFRNKRVALIGDSLNRNMWESLACIVYSSIPNPSSIAQISHDDIPIKTYLKAKGDYNFTIEFFWSPFLVELDKNHESGKNVLVLDKLSPNSEQWQGADIMIFNSGHWWTQMGEKKAWDMYEYKGKLTKDLPLHLAYLYGMRTWANWVRKHVDPTKTTVFFRSISTEHKAPQYDQHCYTKTQPLMDESYKSLYPKTLIRVIENVIKGIRKPKVKYLNITNLSKYRIDAHPSIYRNKDWRILTKNISKNAHDPPTTPIKPDCGHWCLPGIPDTWNRLLYVSLYFDIYVDKSSS